MEGETLVAMSHRHVAEGKLHVEKQRAMISHLRDQELPTDLALELLSQFESALEVHQRHLEQIIQQQRSGERDEGGNLTSIDADPLT